MRNKNSKVAKTKINLSKCEGTCVTYNKIQHAYALKLEDNDEITEIRVNVDLDGLKDDKYPDRVYTTDFVCTKNDNSLMIRECVERKSISKPMTIHLLDMSKNYWHSHGVIDWGIVIDAK